jgi:hypothetical protein
MCLSFRDISRVRMKMFLMEGFITSHLRVIKRMKISNTKLSREALNVAIKRRLIKKFPLIGNYSTVSSCFVFFFHDKKL